MVTAPKMTITAAAEHKTHDELGLGFVPRALSALKTAVLFQRWFLRRRHPRAWMESGLPCSQLGGGKAHNSREVDVAVVLFCWDRERQPERTALLVENNQSTRALSLREALRMHARTPVEPLELLPYPSPSRNIQVLSAHSLCWARKSTRSCGTDTFSLGL